MSRTRHWPRITATRLYDNGGGGETQVVIGRRGSAREREPCGRGGLGDPAQKRWNARAAVDSRRFPPLCRGNPGMARRTLHSEPFSGGVFVSFSLFGGRRTTSCPDDFSILRRSAQMAARSPPNLRVCSIRCLRTSSTIGSLTGQSPTDPPVSPGLRRDHPHHLRVHQGLLLSRHATNHFRLATQTPSLLVGLWYTRDVLCHGGSVTPPSSLDE